MKKLDVTFTTKIGQATKARTLSNITTRELNDVWRAMCAALIHMADAQDISSALDAANPMPELGARVETSVACTVTKDGKPFVTFPPLTWHNQQPHAAAYLVATLDDAFAKAGIKWN